MADEKRSTQTISTAEFESTPRLAIEQATGDIRIEGWDRPEIEVSVADPDMNIEVAQSGSQVTIRSTPMKFNLGSFLEPHGHALDDFGIDLEKVAAKVERKVQRGLRHAGHRFGARMDTQIDIGRWGWLNSRDYVIKVPHDCDLSLRTSTGDLSVKGVNGTFLLQSSSGDISLEQVKGNAIVSSASGDIHIDDLDGKLGLRTASGDVEVFGASLQELSASSASGDITLLLNRVPDRAFEAKTISGDVSVTLPSDSQLTAEASTLSGDIRCAFPGEKVQRTSSGRRNTTLVINGGGASARFATVSGDVVIRPLREASAGGTPTTGLSRAEMREAMKDAASDSDMNEPEGYAARQQAELEILQALERGEITSQEAMRRLGELGG